MTYRNTYHRSTATRLSSNRLPWIKLLLVVSMSFVISPVTASNSLPTFGFCDHCYSSASFLTKAEQVSLFEAPLFEGIHKVYIINPHSREVRFFVVSRWYEIGDLIPRSSSPSEKYDTGSVRRSSDGYYHAEATPAAPDPEISGALSESIEATHEFRQQLAGYIDFDSLDLPPELELNSAIDLIGPEDSSAGLNRSRMRNVLNNHLNDRIGNLTIALGDLALRLLNRMISKSGLLNNFTVTVQFPDGTTIAITIRGIQEGFQGDPNLFEMEIIESSAQGPGLPAVPGSHGQFSGFSYVGNSDIVQELMQLARLYGIPVTGPGGGPPPVNGDSVICEINGNHIKCTVTGGRN